MITFFSTATHRLQPLLLFTWRIFGNSGRIEWQPGLVTERFNKAARLHDPVNRSFKTLFTKLDTYHCRLLPQQPRYPQPARLSELCYVNGAGIVLPRYFCDESRADFLQSEPDQVSWKLAQVNHYQHAVLGGLSGQASSRGR